MPQFDLANFVPQLAWLTFFFVILYFGIIKTTLPKISRVVDERERTVGDDLSTAANAKSDADRIRADYEAGIAEAQAKAQASVGEAKAASSRATEARLAELGRELESRIGEAQAGIARAREGATAEIERIATEAAGEIVARLTGDRPADGEVATAVSSIVRQSA
jgi:F-type H+-transporting ATPase subunit b